MIDRPQATVRILDEVNVVVRGLTSDHIDHLYKRYSVNAPNYFFHPKFKLGQWDGKIHYFHKTGKTYLYLVEEILPHLVKLGYGIKLEDLRNTLTVNTHAIDDQIFSDINHLDTGQPLRLRDYQVEAVNELIKHGYGIVIAGTGAGKAQPLSSKILTPVGWKTMGEIQVGEDVVTPSGSTAKVIGVFPQGVKQIYEITLHDGSKARACAEHLWEVNYPTHNYRASTKRKIVQTKDIINFLNRKRAGEIHTPGNISLPLCAPVPMPEQHLLIDPYVLGALIGDGSLTHHVGFSNVDDVILNRIANYCFNNELKLIRVESSRCDYRLSKAQPANSCPPTPNPLKEKLKELSLHGCNSSNKFIPSVYKRGSIQQRWELIRGIFDTDGTVDKRGNISFTTTSHQLALDVQQIIWSLGGTCTIALRSPTYTYNGKTLHGRVAYTLHVRHSSPASFFFTPKKKSLCLKSHGKGRIELMRRIVDVKLVCEELAQCILIDDPKHLYITDDYIVTHNTLSCAALVKAYDNQGIRSLTIVPDQTLIRQTKREYINCGLDTGEYSGTTKTLNHTHIVSTWQALKNNPKVVAMFGMVIVDECHGLKGNVLSKLLTDHAANIPYRFGFTGTLPKEESDKLAVHVAVGPVRYTTHASELMDRGILASLQINIVQLEEDLKEQYQTFCKEECHGGTAPTYIQYKDQYFGDFAAEKSYLQRNPTRIEWIAAYLSTLREAKKGNILCLVDNIAFGRKLAESIEGAICINGKDATVTERQTVYEMFNDRDDLIVIATVHIAGTGLNIPRIHVLATVDIGKSFIRVIQAIGRSLRKAEGKHSAMFVDICSDLKYSKKHARQRINYYEEAKYSYKKQKIDYAKMLETN